MGRSKSDTLGYNNPAQGSGNLKFPCVMEEATAMGLSYVARYW